MKRRDFFKCAGAAVAVAMVPAVAMATSSGKTVRISLDKNDPDPYATTQSILSSRHLSRDCNPHNPHNLRFEDLYARLP